MKRVACVDVIFQVRHAKLKTTRVKKFIFFFRAGFSIGDHTLFVPNTLFAENRRRLCQRLRENTNVPRNAIVVLQGGESVSLYDTDVEYVFRQVSYS
jgi:hypothetical protein